jgi:predicted GNAT superfamily acetyltransferase
VSLVSDVATEAPADGTPEGLEIRVLTSTADLRHTVTLFNQVWGTVTPLVGVELLRAIEHTGGYVAAAFHGEQIVGASVGLLARHEGEAALHSHITGIQAGLRETGLGRAMKRHQRAWAREHGLAWITWTFDPLVRRNAWFNLHVLRARAHEYLVDFYGPIDDAINHGDQSDRLLVAWPTSGELPEPATEPGPGLRTVPTPEDIVVLRRTDPAAAMNWRVRVRDELGEAMAAGTAVVGVTRDGEYLLRR